MKVTLDLGRHKVAVGNCVKPMDIDGIWKFEMGYPKLPNVFLESQFCWGEGYRFRHFEKLDVSGLGDLEAKWREKMTP